MASEIPTKERLDEISALLRQGCGPKPSQGPRRVDFYDAAVDLMAEVGRLQALVLAGLDWQQKVITERDRVVVYMVKRAEETRDNAIERADRAERELDELVAALKPVQREDERHVETIRRLVAERSEA